MSQESAPAPPPRAAALIHLYRLAADLHGLFEMSAHPDDLLKVDGFMAGVGLPGDDYYGIPDLLRNYAGDNGPIACMAMEALSRRPSDPSCVAGGLVRNLAHMGSQGSVCEPPWDAQFSFRRPSWTLGEACSLARVWLRGAARPGTVGWRVGDDHVRRRLT